MNTRNLAELLIEAEEKRHPVSCLTDSFPFLDVTKGYHVQDELINIRTNQGHESIAFKMGITSLAKMKQMNISEPIYGTVFDYMQVPNKGEMAIEELIHPKVEAEIAFILAEDVEGPGITGKEVLEKTAGILPAFEVIDSRYKNFKFKISDVIADNTSASRVVFGDTVFDAGQFDMEKGRVSLFINGELQAKGTSDAVLGNPANSVAVLANMLNAHGKGKIPKGSIILTGGITEAIRLTKGDHVISTFDGMGEISFYVR